MKLSNERYEVTFVNKGGEIMSFRDMQTGIQYMWQGDESYWSGKNPTLFPLIANTYTKTYVVDGKEYAMKNHGFIRNMDLKTVKDDGHEVIMELDSNDETMMQYPFPFHYEVAYHLEGDTLQITYHITNTGDREMPFHFGLHPAFNCPLTDGERFEDYTMKFSSLEQFEQLVFDPQKEHPYTLEPITLQEIPCDYALIERYATLIYKHPKSSFLTLEGKKGHGVNISLTGYPYIAIWTAKEGAPFICLEPWYGHGDFSKLDVDFYHREGTMMISPQKTFTTAYTIRVF